MIIFKVNIIISIIILESSSLNAFFVKSNNDGRIVGGQTVNIESIPFQVSLQYSYHFCGGSLIGKNYVLTAAHCTQGSLMNIIKVRIGSTNSKEGGILVPVKHIYVHDKYDPRTIDYDFSILELENYKNENVPNGYAHLPENDTELEDGTMLIISGWGNTLDDNIPRHILRAAKVPKVNQEKCKIAYSSISKVTDRMICAGYREGGKDSCQGDSGGPLFVNNTLIGVVSWGNGCANPNFPGVYSRVASVRKWIRLVTSI